VRRWTRPAGRVLAPGRGMAAGLTAVRRRDGPALRADLVAGLTVAAYLVPQVLAYGELAGLPAVAGLWASAAALGAYALLGSSRLLSVGPESTTAIMTALAVGPLALGDPGRHAALAAVLALLVGAICLAGRLAHLGFLADMLSRPVLVGYLTGIALIMIAGQLGRLTGIPVEGGTFVDDVLGALRGLDRVHPPTLLLSLAVLVLLFAGTALAPRPVVPVPLLAVLLAAAAKAVLHLDRAGVAVVGAVPVGLPVPALPAVTAADVAGLLLPAAGVALVAYSDDVLTARAVGARPRERIDADRELLALGAANVAAGAVAGFPVSSSGSRTAVSAAAGGRTQLTSLVALGAVVLVLLVAGPVLAVFPAAALGALVVFAAVRLVEPAEFRRFARFRRSELALAVATAVAVLALGVLQGVLAAVGLSVLDLLRRVSRPHDAVLGFVPGLAGMHDVEDHPGATTVPGLVVHRYDAPLFFANAEDFRHRALAALDGDPTARWLLLDLEAVVEVDVTATDALHALCDELAARGVVPALARVKHELLADLDRGGLLARIGAGRVFPTLPTAVAAFRDATARQDGARGDGPERRRDLRP
jgi:sulfate permease, SulP family